MPSSNKTTTTSSKEKGESSSSSQNKTESSQAVVNEPKKYSDEVMKAIEKMYKLVDNSHVAVYPPEPAPGILMVPTGGFARCQCHPGCTKELPEPAYMVFEQEKCDRFASRKRKQKGKK